MAILPTTFPTAAGAPVATYDYYDYADGTGHVIFYGAVSEANGTKKYFLTTNAQPSNQIVTSGAVTSGGTGPLTYAKAVDVDFDLEFKQPQIIEGTGRIIFTQGGSAPDTTAIKYVKAFVYFRKYDGTTETTLVSGATASTKILQYTNIPCNDTRNIGLVIPRTYFKKGDTLRTTIEIYGYGSVWTLHCGLGHDPDERAEPYAPKITVSGGYSTQMQVHIPFIRDT